MMSTTILMVVDDDALVSLADLATMAGVSRPAVSNWRRRHDDFPSPTQESGTTTLFRFGAIKEWMALHKKPLTGRSAEQAVWTALNPARDAVLPENAAAAAQAAGGAGVTSAAQPAGRRARSFSATRRAPAAVAAAASACRRSLKKATEAASARDRTAAASIGRSATAASIAAPVSSASAPRLIGPSAS